MPTESELNLIGNVEGKNVLELGCGGGECSIEFAKKGARVTGIDLSDAQVEYAKRIARKNRVRINFLVGDITDISRIKSNSMDIVFSAYAFQYIKNLRKVFDEARRVLKINGIFVFSLDHPVWNIFKFGTLKVNKSYFERGLDYFYWKFKGKPKIKAFNVRRTLEDIFTDLVNSGFVVERVIEPSPVKKDKASDFSKVYPRKILKIIPSTIIFKCRKK